jgi:glycosyltransferase involved in cell wall biosynthesis
MRLTFVVPGSRQPIGGAVALYQFANAMRRRSHDVQLVHIGVIGDSQHDFHRLSDPVRSRDDLAWMPFDSRIAHEFPERFDERALPPGDVVFFYGDRLPARCGLPVIPIQGQGALASRAEELLFFAPCPKLCIGRWLMQTLRDMGVPPNQLVYVPNGVDHGVFRVQVPMKHRPCRVAMHYNSHPVKGSQAGLAALARTKERLPDMSAVLFGREDPPEGLPDWIAYLQHASPEEIARSVHNESAVFLWSSLSEGFGLPAVEAMACGTALVTTSNGGSADFAIDGETALVCEPGDDKAMADAIEKLLYDDALRTALATRGHEYVQRFDWDASAARLERFLQRYRADPDYYQAPQDADGTADVE